VVRCGCGFGWFGGGLGGGGLRRRGLVVADAELEVADGLRLPAVVADGDGALGGATDENRLVLRAVLDDDGVDGSRTVPVDGQRLGFTVLAVGDGDVNHHVAAFLDDEPVLVLDVVELHEERGPVGTRRLL
jgi:hypothetical protein